MVKIRKSTSPSGTVGQSSTEGFQIPHPDQLNKVPYLLDTGLPSRKEEWVIADWVKRHVCGNMQFFTEISKLPFHDRIAVSLDGLNTVYPTGVGTVELEAKSNRQWIKVCLVEVLYVPGCDNLLSKTKFAEEGYILNADKGVLQSMNDPKNNLECRFPTAFGISTLKSRPIRINEQKRDKFDCVLQPNECALYWHLRLDHMSQEKFDAALKTDLIKCDRSGVGTFACQVCIDKPKVYEQMSDKGVKIGDVLLVLATEKNFKSKIFYNVMLKDKATDFCWGTVAKSTEHVAKYVAEFLKLFQQAYRCKLNKMEFTNAAKFSLFDKIKKVAHRSEVSISTTATVDPTFQSIMERLAFTISPSENSTKMWKEAFKTAVYFQNISPCINQDGITPYERLKSEKPNVDHLKIIGSSVIPLDANKKIMRKNWILVGFTQTNGYVLYSKDNDQIIETANAMFFEERQVLRHTKLCSSSTPTPSAPLEGLISSNASQVSQSNQLNQPSQHFPPHQTTSQKQPNQPSCSNQISLPNSSIQNIRSKHLKFIFQKLLSVDFNTKQALTDILEPFEEGLKRFEHDAKNTVPYTLTSKCVRSKSLDRFSLGIKYEFEPLETTANGNCLFYAVSLALFGNETNSELIRLLILRHIVTNWDLLEKACPPAFGMPIQALAKSVATLKKWGVEQHMFLLSEILEKPFYTAALSQTLDVQVRIFNSNPLNEMRPAIYILLFAHHYEALVPKDPSSIKTITKQHSINFYANVTHKYIYNGSLNVDVNNLTFERAVALYPDISDEWKLLKNLSPEVIELTDDDNDDAIKIYSCLNCKKFNQRIKELNKTNADLRKINRHKISQDTRLQSLPAIPCKSCADLLEQKRAIESQNDNIRAQFNRRGENLVRQIQELTQKNDSLFRQKEDLSKGNEIIIKTLAQRTEDLAALASKIEEYKEFEFYRTQLTAYWTRNPSGFSPVRTPGRQTPEYTSGIDPTRPQNHVSRFPAIKQEPSSAPTMAGGHISSSGQTIQARNATSLAASNANIKTESTSELIDKSASKSVTTNIQPKLESPAVKHENKNEKSDDKSASRSVTTNKQPKLASPDVKHENKNEKSDDKNASTSVPTNKQPKPESPEVKHENEKSDDDINFMQEIANYLVSSGMEPLFGSPQFGSPKSSVDLNKDLYLSSSSSSNTSGVGVGTNMTNNHAVAVSTPNQPNVRPENFKSSGDEVIGTEVAMHAYNKSRIPLDESDISEDDAANVSDDQTSWDSNTQVESSSDSSGDDYGPKKQPYKCSECPRIFNSANVFAAHKLDHNARIPLDESDISEDDAANVSDDQTSWDSNTKVESSSDSSGDDYGPKKQPYKCSECPRIFNSANVFAAHKLDHNARIPLDESDISEDDAASVSDDQTSWDSNTKVESSSDSSGDDYGPKKQPYKCSECPRIFNSANMFAAHKLEHNAVGPQLSLPWDHNLRSNSRHNLRPRTNTTAASSNTRTNATVNAKSKNADMHAETISIPGVSGNITVAVPVRFRDNIKNLQSKLQTNSHANQSQPSSTNKTKLSTNFKRKPEQKTKDVTKFPFQCSTCGNRYTAKGSLNRHLETSHSEFKIPCRFCKETFSCNENLSKHSKRMHRGSREQKCRFCPHTLTKSKKAMETHEISKHFDKYVKLMKKEAKNNNEEASSDSADDCN